MIEELDFTGHFSAFNVVPEPKPTVAELKHIDDLGMIGEEKLKTNGLYVRMVTALPSGHSRVPSECTVLVVDDDAATVRLITTVLEKSGYRTRRAGNRKEVVAELALKPRPDLILLDVMMPDVNGFDVLNRIRQHPLLQQIHVVMLTSLSERKYIAKGIMLGADGYLTKPLLPSALLDAVQTITAG